MSDFSIPALTETEVRLLRVLDAQGVVRGNVLWRKAGMADPAEAVQPLQHLVDLGLITVTGSVADGDAVESAVFTVLPSRKQQIVWQLGRPA